LFLQFLELSLGEDQMRRILWRFLLNQSCSKTSAYDVTYQPAFPDAVETKQNRTPRLTATNQIVETLSTLALVTIIESKMTRSFSVFTGWTVPHL